MSNISKALTKSQPPQPTTLMTLQNYTEKKQAFNALARMEQNLTIRQSLEDAPLMIYSGEKIAIIKQVIRVIEFFLEVTGNKLETYQIQVLAGDLYEKFSHETFDDIVLMFKMARRGEFGKVYKFDTMLVMDWAGQYLERKTDEREKLVRSRPPQEQEEKKEDAPLKYFHELSEEMQEKFAKIGQNSTKMPAFLPKKATEEMSYEKHRREIQKIIEKEK
jgi:hypothetical protein